MRSICLLASGLRLVDFSARTIAHRTWLAILFAALIVSNAYATDFAVNSSADDGSAGTMR
jgi:hypothetical protein